MYLYDAVNQPRFLFHHQLYSPFPLPSPSANLLVIILVRPNTLLPTSCDVHIILGPPSSSFSSSPLPRSPCSLESALAFIPSWCPCSAPGNPLGPTRWLSAWGCHNQVCYMGMCDWLILKILYYLLLFNQSGKVRPAAVWSSHWHSWSLTHIKVHLIPKYFFRSRKSLHLFKMHSAFLPPFNPNLDLQAVKVTKSSHHLSHDQAGKGHGSIPGLMSQTDLHLIKYL